jgi:hypothetical protein
LAAAGSPPPRRDEVADDEDDDEGLFSFALPVGDVLCFDAPPTPPPAAVCRPVPPRLASPAPRPGMVLRLLTLANVVSFA